MQRIDDERTLSERYGWQLLALSIAAPLAMDFALWLWRTL